MKCKKLFVAMAFCAGSFGLVGSIANADGKHAYHCKKGGKVIKVKGKDDEEKKADCTSKGGSWEMEEHDHE